MFKLKTQTSKIQHSKRFCKRDTNRYGQRRLLPISLEWFCILDCCECQPVERYQTRSTAVLYVFIISTNQEPRSKRFVLSCNNDCALYASIDAEAYGEVVYYLGPDFVIRDCAETNLNNLSCSFVDQGRLVLIVHLIPHFNMKLAEE